MFKLNYRMMCAAGLLLALTVCTASSGGTLYVNENGGDGNTTSRYDTATGQYAYDLDPVRAQAFDGTSMGLCIGADTTGDGVGEVYRSGYYSGGICKYDGATGAFISQVTTDVFRPMSISFGPDGNLYASQFVESYIKVFDGTTGAYIKNFTTANYAGSMAWGSNGHLFTPSWVDNNVTEWDATGALVRTLDAGGAAGLSTAAGAAFGPDGKLYVASGGNNKIVRYDVTTGSYVDTFISGGNLSAPRGISFGQDFTGDGIADLYVASSGNNKILQYDGVTGAYYGTFATTSMSPAGLAYAGAAAPVPEPGTLAGIASGIAMLGLARVRRFRRG